MSRAAEAGAERSNRGGAARRAAGAGALALAVAVPHAGPALAPIVPPVGRRLGVVLRDEGNPGRRPHLR